MEVIIGKTAGFCFGVANAVKKAKEISKAEKEIYCLGEIVHNKQVTKELEDNGIAFVENIEQARNNMIIRTHGITKEIYKEATQKGIKLFDLTCPNVVRIHDIVEKYAKNNYYIFLLGERKHPETIGTMSFCGDNYTVIEDETEIEKAIENFKKSNLKNSLLISQTTYSLEKFNNIKYILENEDLSMEVKNTICQATKQRQEETEKMASKVDMMIIIGGKNSSNTKKLYDISKKNCKNAIHIETKKELEQVKFDKYTQIGIMAGASTPCDSIYKVVEFIKNI